MKVVKFISKLLVFYVLLFYIWVILSKLLLIYPLMFNIILISILLISVILNKKFNKIRKIIFILFCICQYIMYWYLDIILILLIKDIFWYSLILNMAFIWHHLILPLLYEMCEKKGNDYMCFIISRIGLLTSLSWISIIISWVFVVKYRYKDYYIDYYNLIGDKEIISSKYLYYLRFCLIELVDVIFSLLYKILHYFIRSFTLYSLFVMGLKKSSYTWNELMKYMLIFFILIILSFLLGVPRIYIIWIYFSVMYIYIKIKYKLVYLYKKNKIRYKERFIYEFLCGLNSSINWEFPRKPLIENWEIFEEDLINDYLCFLEIFDWVPQTGCFYFDLYEVCGLLKYEKDYRMKINVLWEGHILERDFMGTYYEESREKYKIKNSIEEMEECKKKLLKEGCFDSEWKDVNEIKLWKYVLGLDEHRILISSRT